MPFQSEAQRRFLWAKHPDIAERWAHGEHSSSGPHRMPAKGKNRNLPYHKRKSRKGGRRGKRS